MRITRDGGGERRPKKPPPPTTAAAEGMIELKSSMVVLCFPIAFPFKQVRQQRININCPHYSR